MSRGYLIAVTAAAGLTLAGLTTGSADAAAATCTQFFDVNHDGNEDIVVGTPGEDVGYNGHNRIDAGTVTVVYGDANGAFGYSDGRSYSADDLGLKPVAHDRLGAAVLVADLNGDGCGDLVIGAPGKNSGAGAVVILYGTPRGAGSFGTDRQVLRQGVNGAPGKAEAGDHFGAALATWAATGSVATQLWVGAPGEDIARPGPDAKDAGSVTVYPAASGNLLPTSGIAMRTQNSAGYGTSAESGDHFGAVLAGLGTTILVGVPGEDLGQATNAGMFHSVTAGGSPRNWRQAGVSGTGGAEKGDRFGGSLAMMSACSGDRIWAVGAPGEDIGPAKDAGLVVVYDQQKGTQLRVQQGLGGVPGGAEAGDQFGAALVGAGDRIAVGSPGEDISGKDDAGSVVTFGVTCSDSSLSLSSVQNWYQGANNVGGKPSKNDRFGAGLGATTVLVSKAPQRRLLIAMPGEDESSQDGELVNSGMVLSLPGGGSGFTGTGSTRFGQNTHDGDNEIPGVGETNDAFGSSLSGTNPGY